MCGIIGSFSKEKILDLDRLNEDRGNKAFSFAVFDDWFRLHKIFKRAGQFDENFLKRDIYGSYFILHIQSPTKLDEIIPETIHPSTIDNISLWHNGMVLDSCLETLKKELNETSNWDTRIILQGLIKEGYSFLEKIEGSFACLLYKDEKISLFRNQIVPLYIDSELNISSAQFENSEEIDSNKIYQLDFKNKILIHVNNFVNNHNPYSF